ncbi:pentatricopeptide repeat-containing protein At4g35130, chloroplastic [Andrographis paniculata]|uniref:pentatricopeptide repeat-containing protein At4g35130, chloroplastic n=1 Tax=Andrographis paniculata TaxID=175694 RepID=UPI0021E87EC9|nr:pentatricopeptide repeat-containing protein At4g35130, chloroplastic [Andrographis paniculata]
MATALLGFYGRLEPTISQQVAFPAKISASRKTTQSHERRIERSSKRNSSSLIGRTIRRLDCSVSPIKKLLSYLKSDCLENALQLFDEMTKPNTFVWNVMIRALVDSELFEKAIEYYYRMQNEDIKPDHFTFPFVIKACTGMFSLKEGQKVHSAVIKFGLDSDVYISNALIVMYAKAGRVEDSEKVFKHMSVRDAVSWNSMIFGYVSVGDGWNSLFYFRKMQEHQMEVDRFSYVGALIACSIECHLRGGKEIFCQVLRNGHELDSMIRSSLIDMFGKCGEVYLAENLFFGVSETNVVVWNAMIGAYVSNDRCLESFSCLRKMQRDHRVAPDVVTLINTLPACSKVKALSHGKAIHGYAIRRGFSSHVVLETALVDMYGKCDEVALSECLFNSMKERNLVTWNAMIGAYVQNSRNIEAVEMFRILLRESCLPDEWTFASILAAYAEIALPKEGQQVHGYVIKSGTSYGTLVSNSIIHMYAKSGDLESARKVFDRIVFKDVITWNTIIMSYAIHGFGECCFRLFEGMMNDGIGPNAITFVALLTACSVAGFVDEGWAYFHSMKNDYGIKPGIEHYGCILDLLGRSGELDRARRFIEEIPVAPTHRIWGSLLVASRHYKNIELAEMAASHLSTAIDTDNIGSYILLSNLYAEVGRWEDVERIKSLMKERGLERTIGRSIVEYRGRIYEFKNHDRSKIESGIVYDVLDVVLKRIGKEEDRNVRGMTKFKPRDVIKKREGSPAWHSVRLAICFGLIGSAVGKPVVVRKNVRMCESCHVVAKKMSEVLNREIVVDDSKTYHHFNSGRCSCGDWW